MADPSKNIECADIINISYKFLKDRSIKKFVNINFQPYARPIGLNYFDSINLSFLQVKIVIVMNILILKDI